MRSKGFFVAGIAVFSMCALITVFFFACGISARVTKDAPIIFGRAIYNASEDMVNLPGGSAIAVDKEKKDLRVGDAFVYKDSNGEAQCRYVVRVEAGGYLARIPDSENWIMVLDEDVIGKAVGFIPVLGTFITFASSSAGIIILAVLTVLFAGLVTFLILTMARSRTRPKKKVYASSHRLKRAAPSPKPKSSQPSDKSVDTAQPKVKVSKVEDAIKQVKKEPRREPKNEIKSETKNEGKREVKKETLIFEKLNDDKKAAMKLEESRKEELKNREEIKREDTKKQVASVTDIRTYRRKPENLALHYEMNKVEPEEKEEAPKEVKPGFDNVIDKPEFSQRPEISMGMATTTTVGTKKEMYLLSKLIEAVSKQQSYSVLISERTQGESVFLDISCSCEEMNIVSNVISEFKKRLESKKD